MRIEDRRSRKRGLRRLWFFILILPPSSTFINQHFPYRWNDLIRWRERYNNPRLADRWERCNRFVFPCRNNPQCPPKEDLARIRLRKSTLFADWLRNWRPMTCRFWSLRLSARVPACTPKRQAELSANSCREAHYVNRFPNIHEAAGKVTKAIKTSGQSSGTS